MTVFALHGLRPDFYNWSALVGRLAEACGHLPSGAAWTSRDIKSSDSTVQSLTWRSCTIWMSLVRLDLMTISSVRYTQLRFRTVFP